MACSRVQPEASECKAACQQCHDAPGRRLPAASPARPPCRAQQRSLRCAWSPAHRAWTRLSGSGRGEGGWPGTMQQTTVSSACWTLDPTLHAERLGVVWAVGICLPGNAPSACLVASCLIRSAHTGSLPESTVQAVGVTMPAWCLHHTSACPVLLPNRLTQAEALAPVQGPGLSSSPSSCWRSSPSSSSTSDASCDCRMPTRPISSWRRDSRRASSMRAVCTRVREGIGNKGTEQCML